MSRYTDPTYGQSDNRRRVLIAAAVAVLLLLTGAAYLFTSGKSGAEEPPPTTATESPEPEPTEESGNSSEGNSHRSGGGSDGRRSGGRESGSRPDSRPPAAVGGVSASPASYRGGCPATVNFSRCLRAARPGDRPLPVGAQRRRRRTGADRPVHRFWRSAADRSYVLDARRRLLGVAGGADPQPCLGDLRARPVQRRLPDDRSGERDQRLPAGVHRQL